VFSSEISAVSSFILSALLFTMNLYVGCLFLVEYFPGNVIVCVCNVSVFQNLFLGWLCALQHFFLEFHAVSLSRTLYSHV
jgi:hypothetical protein